MPAYFLANIKVTNPDGYKAYVAVVQPTIERHGGRFLVRGGNPKVFEGSWPGDRFVILEFKDKATADAWYNSPEYQAILKMRTENSIGCTVLLEAFEPA